MITADKDVLAVLQAMAASGEAARLAKVQARHDEQTQRRMETQFELLADVVERYIPRNHPLFQTVLLEAALRKVSQQHQPEDESFLGEDW
jgi:prophage DNA circulation protein